MISIHAPQWGATEVAAGVVLVLVISIHAPQWGATPENGPSFAGENDFNPRTPVGCDEDDRQHEHDDEISIHAPQWGATNTVRITSIWESFQSTHPSGVRPSPPPPRWNAWNFNPRTPVGCDVGHLSGFGARQVISIHAPQWGATKRGFRRKIDAEFQSTHPSGVRLDGVAGSASPVAFQSTHPSGVRRASPRPSARMGGISIHAPQWGATRHEKRDHAAIQISIHAPQWGATRQMRRSSTNCGISIHAPQWGATIFSVEGFVFLRYFNPRTPVGCDRTTGMELGTFSYFNPRTPVGCD